MQGTAGVGAAATAVLALLLGACTHPSGPGIDPAAASTPPAAGTGLDAGRAALELVPVSRGYHQPLALRHAADGSGRVYVLEQGGRILRVAPSAKVVDGEPYFDLNAEGGPPFGFSGAGGERGLLGLAFDPAFRENGRLYLNYTDGQGDTVVARYRAATPPASGVDRASVEVLLRIDQPYSNHNAGDLAFGADGLLYVPMGDGGSGGDPCNYAQSLDAAALEGPRANAACLTSDGFAGVGANPRSRALLGKLLRIDVNAATAPGTNALCGARADGSAPYAIPADNPYAGDDAQHACDEVWAYGLRNPWRVSFDRENGDLYLGDVGQNRVEEVDLHAESEPAGQNYGWNRCEGDLAFPDASEPCAWPDGPTTPRPILSYLHQDGDCSVTGGYRYRGPIEALRGTYVFGDYCTGRIWFARPENGKWVAHLWRRTGMNISSFGEDEEGNLYVVDYGGGKKGKGAIWRFAPARTP